MAGDWIKMRVDLADDPAVIGVAAALGVEEDLVVGKLHRLWSWADRHTVDGNAPSVTEAWLDRYLNAPGFAKALVAEGWLVIKSTGIQIPDFEAHNGQSGKQRALTAKRAGESRSRKRNAPTVTKSAPTEEKRREEKRRDKTDHLDLCSKKAQEQTLSLALRKFTGGEPPIFPRDRLSDKQIETLLKTAALLDAGRLTEDQVTSGLESIRLHEGKPIRDRVAWFARVLGKETEGQFGKLLATVRLPKEMIQAWRDAT